MNCLKSLKKNNPLYRYIKLNNELENSWMQSEFATMFTDHIPTLDEWIHRSTRCETEQCSEHQNDNCLASDENTRQQMDRGLMGVQGQICRSTKCET